MCWSSEYITNWLVDTNNKLTTVDGGTVDVFELQHQPDNEILSAWAKHFRNHYCSDNEIDELRNGPDLSRKDYLEQLIFPDRVVKPGPSIRSGDFAEILVADYLEFLVGFCVPRFRYDRKAIRNESTKGADIVGFRFFDGNHSPKDELAIIEAKATLSSNGKKTRLQDAVDDSKKDFQLRKAETLNALRQRLKDRGDIRGAENVKRFQNKTARPYKEYSGAVAVFTSEAFDEVIISQTDVSSHPNSANLFLVVIKGDNLMPLVHELYKRAANEA